ENPRSDDALGTNHVVYVTELRAHRKARAGPSGCIQHCLCVFDLDRERFFADNIYLLLKKVDANLRVSNRRRANNRRVEFCLSHLGCGGLELLPPKFFGNLPPRLYSSVAYRHCPSDVAVFEGLGVGLCDAARSHYPESEFLICAHRFGYLRSRLTDSF